MNSAKSFDNAEIKIQGIEALNKALGPAAALRFLTIFHWERTDYVSISRRLYKDQSIDDIFERAKKQWKSTKK